MPAGYNYQWSSSTSCRIVLAQVEAIVLVPYKDGHHDSIGIGYNDVKGEYKGKTITVEESFDLLKRALHQRERDLEDMLKDNHYPITQNEYDALLIMMYQSGNRYVPAMDALLKHPGGKPVASALFPLCAYNKAGEYMKGLVVRRMREKAIFDNADYGPINLPVKLYRNNPHDDPKAFEAYTLQPGDID
jgi:GH24 family phage-related lysozyme (muramidase)